MNKGIWVLLLTLVSGLTAQTKAPMALPPGVHYSVDATGLHRYEIKGLYVHHLPEESRNEADLEEILTGALPYRSKATLKCDLSRDRLVIILPNKVDGEELDKLCGIMVGGQVVPSWHELAAREFPQSKKFPGLRFQHQELEAENPTETQEWSKPARFEPVKIPIDLPQSEKGFVVATPIGRYCMCHSRFVLRILDSKGATIWKSKDDLLKGITQIALTDEGKDGVSEILVHCSDHGKKKQHRFSVVK